VPALLRGGDFLLASHTGSGKTLAYLLPIVNALKAQEEAAGGAASRPRRPRALILGPTKELAEQITRVAKALCHVSKFRAACLSANTPMRQQREALACAVDLVVATPTRFAQHMEEEGVFLGDVTWLARAALWLRAASPARLARPPPPGAQRCMCS